MIRFCSWAIAWLGVLFLLAPFLYAYGFCFPRGDDFDEYTRAMFLFDVPGAFYELAREWLTWSGRYVYHFLAVLLAKVVDSRILYGLTCFFAAMVYAWGAYILAACVTQKKGAKLFFCALVLVCLYCGNPTIYNYYLYMDALSSGLQGGLFLLFCAFLCRMEKHDPGISAKDWRCCLISGIAAIGTYESSALAVVCTSASMLIYKVIGTRGQLKGMPASSSVKSLWRLFLWLCVATCLSFAAPGNFARSSIRGVDTARKLEQLGSLFNDWFNSISQISLSSLAILVFCSAIFLASFGECKNKRPMAAIFCAILFFFLFTLSTAALLAMSDTPLGGEFKHTWNMAAICAVPWGLMIHILARSGKFFCQWRYPVRIFAIAAIFLVAFHSTNFQNTAINSANGAMVMLARFMEVRIDALKEIAAKNAGKRPDFGLLGEIRTPDARRPQIVSALGNASLDAWSNTVFPVYMHEAHPQNPQNWPNLWAAWFYGTGSVHATLPPLPYDAISGSDNLELAVGNELKSLGMDRIWLAKAAGNLGRAMWWLVVKGEKPAHISILLPSWPCISRLAPLHLQQMWLNRILAERTLEPSFSTLLGTIKINAPQGIPAKDGIFGVPLDIYGPLKPKVIFLSVNGSAYYRAEPPL